MAKAAGFTCDRVGCGVFATAGQNGNSTQLPEGWIMVTPMPKVYPGTEARPKEALTALELCSNKCLVELALERYEAEHDKPYKVVGSGRGMTYEKSPCENCGKPVAPQGRAKHLEKCTAP